MARERLILSKSTWGWSKQRLLLASGVVALLLVTHVALMASERHAAVMSRLHEQFSTSLTIPVAAHAVARAASPSPAPAAPLHLIGECPGQAAVAPLLLLLLALIGMRIGAGGPAGPVVTNQLGHRSAVPALPPVAAHRRRALLQIYLN